MYEVIGYVHTDLPEKFGVPRQAGLVKELTGVIDFLPKYRNPDAFAGIEGFSHIWVLWRFDVPDKYHATVHPPRLGGNTPAGVFATRSPFRPNPIGLSCVKLERVEYTDEGPKLYVSGVDMRDSTAVIDIKPYLSYTDAHPEAVDGFAEKCVDYGLSVDFPQELLLELPEDKREAAAGLLSQDPRPAYQDDENRLYGVSFAGHNIRFFVKEGVLTVTEVTPLTGREL